MVDFHGWEMPLRYGSIPEEHLHVRAAAGLFDLGHMGRLEISGPDATAWVDRILTNDFRAMAPGDARYSLILNDEGTIIDDAIVYKVAGPSSDPVAFLVVNASNRGAVVTWLRQHGGDFKARCDDRTDALGMLAIQGPLAVAILAEVVELEGTSWDDMRYYTIADARMDGEPLRVARTGYTGEDGFEVYLATANTATLWRRLLEVGGERLRPIGLGARDTLRLEAAMPLYGHEINSNTHPYEVGLGFAVKLAKADGFIGRDRLLALKDERARQGGSARRLVGFRVDGRRIARQGMEVFVQGETHDPVGEITSGAPSPTLGYPIALAHVRQEALERELEVDIRGHRQRLHSCALPFFSRTRKSTVTDRAKP
jgi:aminomethyltransferase